MDAAYISTLSALAGTVIGAVSTFATSWMTQASQTRTARLNAERARRDELYGKFMEEISSLFAHAASEDEVDFSKLVGIYALRGRILLQSSEGVARQADEAIKLLVGLYRSPHRDAADILDHVDQLDPMKPFAEACRAELAALR